MGLVAASSVPHPSPGNDTIELAFASHWLGENSEPIRAFEKGLPDYINLNSFISFWQRFVV